MNAKLVTLIAFALSMAGFTCTKEPCSQLCDASCGLVKDTTAKTACMTLCQAELVKQDCNKLVSDKLDGWETQVKEWIANLLKAKKAAVLKAKALKAPKAEPPKIATVKETLKAEPAKAKPEEMPKVDPPKPSLPPAKKD